MLTRSAVLTTPRAAVHTVEFDDTRDALDEHLVNLAAQVLTAAEHAQFAAFTRAGRQREWLCARIAGKDAAIAWWSGRGEQLTWQDVEIRTRDSGAPHLAPPHDRAGASMSLAHTARIAVAVVADGPVGIDVERADRSVEVLQRALTDGERDACAQHGRSPLEVLMAKESAGKSLGIGLAGSPAGFDAAFDGEDWWVRTAHLPRTPLRVTITSHGVHLLALCLGSPGE